MGDDPIFNKMQDFFFNNTISSSNNCIIKSSNSSMLDEHHDHMIKKETFHDEDHHDHTNIDIGLNLFPCVASSSGSKAISASDKLTVLKSELERINAENQHLRDKLNQVGNNYRALHGHILAISRDQHYGNLTTNNFKPMTNNPRSNDQDREVRDGLLKSMDIDDYHFDHDGNEDQTKMVRRARVSVRTCLGESMEIALVICV
ncbi:uncharacterized protein LOC124946247 [Impatiens glandulifera]|uniref:uncharacterized protein LOC124946247 n=1 Tax=Impatiens glandulifera TaxID=253017 RepID=UPI001FB0CAAF|nr:uncharacterized protein LOC124946247 [Impatiens glandulifera]